MDELRIIGIDEKGYGKVYKVVMRNPCVSLTAKALYAYFCSYAGSGTSAFPHREKIIRDLNITKNTFTKHLNNLVDSQYIARQRTTLGNIYEILLIVPDENGELIEAKSKGYGTIPKLAMLDSRLTANAKGIYAYLCSYAGSGHVAYPRRSTILRELSISEGKYYRHYNSLIEFGYVTPTQTTEERGRFFTTNYVLNEVLGIDPCKDPDDPTKTASESDSQKWGHGSENDASQCDSQKQGYGGKLPDSQKQGYGEEAAFNIVFNGNSQKQGYGDKVMSQKPMSQKTVPPKLGHPNINNKYYNKQSSSIEEDNIINIRTRAHGDDIHSFPLTKEEVKKVIRYSFLLREFKAWADMKESLGHFATASDKTNYLAQGRRVLDEVVIQLVQFFRRSGKRYEQCQGNIIDYVECKPTLIAKMGNTDFVFDRVCAIVDGSSEVRALRPYIRQTLLNIAVEENF